MIDIEDINRKFDASLAVEYVPPTEEEARQVKPMLDELVEDQRQRTMNDIQKMMVHHLGRATKYSFFMQAFYMLVDMGLMSMEHEPVLQRVFRIKKCRSYSGVLVITIFTSAYPEYIDEDGNTCKQDFSCKWNCAYCPNEPNQPRSYLKGEPGVLRANRHNFDPCEQMWARMAALCQTGHPVDKLEVIVLGGTWASYPILYCEQFIRDTYYAANVFWDKTKRAKLSLEEEKRINHDAKCRVIGLTLETRPDTIDAEEIRRLRSYGCTRVQLGIQHTDNEILYRIRRQCTIEQVKQAIRMLKDCGFKVDGHWMPNLPFSTPQHDRKMLIDQLLGMKKHIQRKRQNGEMWEHYEVSEPDLQLDQWKVYPCAIVPWTDIEKWYNEGLYKPYPEEELRDILMDMKSLVFPWIRLNRIIRDIPTCYIIASSDRPNMRQELTELLKHEGKMCQCIRCREVKNKQWDGSHTLVVRTYPASDGMEYFISAESGDTDMTLYGFLRLRICDSSHHIFPELKNAALIRELHVYGQLNLVGNGASHVQHKGIGRRLVSRAEEIAHSHKLSRTAIIAGEGTKRYYEKLGYREQGTYMMKESPC
jgi:ELP3 family radical SAM enzyme/protein acetyltransferase